MSKDKKRSKEKQIGIDTKKEKSGLSASIENKRKQRAEEKAEKQRKKEEAQKKSLKLGLLMMGLALLICIGMYVLGNGEEEVPSEEPVVEKSTEAPVNDDVEEPLAIDACAGYDTAAVLFSDGSAKKMGDNSSERIGGEEWRDLIDVECGWASNEFIGLKSDGTVVYDSQYQSEVGSWRDIVKIGMGNYPDSPIAGLKNDGTVVCNRTHDQDYADVTKWSDIKDISVSDSHIAAITKTGDVLVAGENDHGACNVDDWSDLDIVQVSAGGGYTAGLKADGTVITTELIGNGLIAEKYIHEVDNWTDITQVCAGLTQIAGITSEGKVVVAHNGDYNYDVSNWENVIKLISGNDALIGINKEGKVYFTGNRNQY